LFDHIPAHRFLEENDVYPLSPSLFPVYGTSTSSLRPQDRSLLPNRNCNVIVTDFGFTNRFERRSDDLVQTSCG
jgi:hypothetical protein